MYLCFAIKHQNPLRGLDIFQRQLWEAVKYDDIDDHEDRRALRALLAAVPAEMASILAKKPTAMLAWEAIA